MRSKATFFVFTFAATSTFLSFGAPLQASAALDKDIPCRQNEEYVRTKQGNPFLAGSCSVGGTAGVCNVKTGACGLSAATDEQQKQLELQRPEPLTNTRETPGQPLLPTPILIEPQPADVQPETNVISEPKPRQSILQSLMGFLQQTPDVTPSNQGGTVDSTDLKQAIWRLTAVERNDDGDVLTGVGAHPTVTGFAADTSFEVAENSSETTRTLDEAYGRALGSCIRAGNSVIDCIRDPKINDLDTLRQRSRALDLFNSDEFRKAFPELNPIEPPKTLEPPKIGVNDGSLIFAQYTPGPERAEVPGGTGEQELTRLRTFIDDLTKRFGFTEEEIAALRTGVEADVAAFRAGRLTFDELMAKIEEGIKPSGEEVAGALKTAPRPVLTLDAERERLLAQKAELEAEAARLAAEIARKETGIREDERLLREADEILRRSTARTVPPERPELESEIRSLQMLAQALRESAARLDALSPKTAEVREPTAVERFFSGFGRFIDRMLGLPSEEELYPTRKAPEVALEEPRSRVGDFATLPAEVLRPSTGVVTRRVPTTVEPGVETSVPLETLSGTLEERFDAAIRKGITLPAIPYIEGARITGVRRSLGGPLEPLESDLGKEFIRSLGADVAEVLAEPVRREPSVVIPPVVPRVTPLPMPEEEIPRVVARPLPVASPSREIISPFSSNPIQLPSNINSGSPFASTNFLPLLFGLFQLLGSTNQQTPVASPAAQPATVYPISNAIPEVTATTTVKQTPSIAVVMNPARPKVGQEVQILWTSSGWIDTTNVKCLLLRRDGSIVASSGNAGFAWIKERLALTLSCSSSVGPVQEKRVAIDVAGE